MFWKLLFQQGYTYKILLPASHIIEQMDKDYYYSSEYAASPLTFCMSHKQSVLADKSKHYVQSPPIHTWVLPAKLPSLKLHRTAKCHTPEAVPMLSTPL